MPWRVPDEWKGETAVIFGGGPSLNQADVDYAISRGWRRIACNNAYLLDPHADVLCWADQRWYLWNRKDLHKHVGKYKVCWRLVPATTGLTIKTLMHHRGVVSNDPLAIVANNTGQGAINLAYLFGAKRILLLGFDMRTHGAQHNWHKLHQRGTAQSRYKEVFGPAIAKAGEAIQKKGVTILNCTKDSAMKCFPIVDIREIQ
jgi:hypothetical protein